MMISTVYNALHGVYPVLAIEDITFENVYTDVSRLYLQFSSMEL